MPPSPFWFVWIPESAYLQLKADNITAIIKDDIKLAPLSAYKNVSTDAPLWEKHHLHLNTETSVDSYFKEPALDPSDPSFIMRDPVYMGKLHPSQYGTSNAARIIQTRFTDALAAKDKRVSYASAKYPWIEAIDQFENPFVESGSRKLHRMVLLYEQTKPKQRVGTRDRGMRSCSDSLLRCFSLCCCCCLQGLAIVIASMST